jgi:two-component system KDP operon response regulator KdpE
VTNAPTADPATILIVEDDPSLRAALAATLKAAGYKPVPAATAAEGRRWFAHYKPDVVLLDLGLPDGDGLDFIAGVRELGAAPVIVLSARDGEAVKVRALDLGADDYVTKPFGVDELLARLRAALRHGVQARGSAPRVRTGDIDIDMGLRTVLKAGAPVPLSPKEYDLLTALAVELGRPVSHPALLRAVWGSERTDLQYLRVYIGQLRQKLDGPESHPSLIVSEPGVGYRLVARPVPATLPA